MNPASILIVEDDTKLRGALKEIMTREGYAVDATESGDTAVSMIQDTAYDLVITDLKLPGIDGMDVLRSVQRLARDTSVIIVTAYATVDTAVEAMKEGAEDYIAKPFNLDEIRLVVRKVLDKKALVDDNRFLRSQLKKKYSFGNLVGNSEAMVEVYKTIEKIKDSRATILILGETGTGKELVARAIHFNSVRSEKPFLPVNCAALAETLLESELFGYVKGAFTGAVRDKEGVFEVAHGGTVFLDEIGDVSPRLQQILLRVLENGEIQPVGSTARRKVDVRVVAATNRELEGMVKQGTFRADLYYRLNVISLELPPLRIRTEDIATLAGHFLRKYAGENGKTIHDISRDALHSLERYEWPGNVRELENVIERATLLEASTEITPESLPESIRNASGAPPVNPDEDLKTLEEVGRTYIETVLKKTGGNKARASEILGINRTSLWRMIQRLKIAQ
ncbi:MAG: sigma-54-dependent Fis family transcriptional regulator [Syntrophorhabdus sp.]|nr:sigma-54-dependent Fis family transcriptional regulator [Syntrophorhabdus sp.]